MMEHTEQMPERIRCEFCHVGAGVGWFLVFSDEEDGVLIGIGDVAKARAERLAEAWNPRIFPGMVGVNEQRLREEFGKLTSPQVKYLPTFEKWLAYLTAPAVEQDGEVHDG